MKNPWATGEKFLGIESAWCDTVSRLDRVKTMSVKKLKAALKWPNTQKAVRLAIERRLRKLGQRKG